MTSILRKAMEKVEEEIEEEKKKGEKLNEKVRDHWQLYHKVEKKLRDARESDSSEIRIQELKDELTRISRVASGSERELDRLPEQIKGKRQVLSVMSTALWPITKADNLGRAKINVELDIMREEKERDEALAQSKEHGRRWRKYKDKYYELEGKGQVNLLNWYDKHASIEAEEEERKRKKADNIGEQIKGKRICLDIIHKELTPGDGDTEKHGMYFLDKSIDDTLAEKIKMEKERDKHLARPMKHEKSAAEHLVKAQEAESSGDEIEDAKLMTEAEQEEEKAAKLKDKYDAIAGQIEGMDIAIDIMRKVQKSEESFEGTDEKKGPE